MVGLVSVTFRALPPEKIILLAVQAGLGCIEWAGDVHAPPEAPDRARQVGELTRRAGLQVCSYGSYHRLCQGQSFAPVLAAAAALGAPNIRIWPGDKSPAEADDRYFEQAGAELAELCDSAAERGISISLEYHRRTLSQTPEGVLRLFELAGRSNLFTYWQPNPELTAAENTAALRAVAPRLSALHLFHWTPEGNRLPLAAGKADWAGYLRAAGQGKPLLLEFVAGDTAEQFFADAAALKSWEEML